MKLHLGCGERYLEGYVNIDFPLSEHSVQKTSVADHAQDLLTLDYPADTIEEIRLHHVFEHFPRPVALALLVKWRKWLEAGGILRIEVPDFERTARYMFSPFRSLKKQRVAIRHIFGSHEAPWAVHCEGYTRQSLKTILTVYSYDILQIIGNKWLNTYNFEIFAKKSNHSFSNRDYHQRTEKLLRQYLLDESESELRLLDEWMKKFHSFVDLGRESPG